MPCIARVSASCWTPPPSTSIRRNLDSRDQRQLTLELRPGGAFTRADVEASGDRDIVITALADGGVLGGMSYRLDPSMERPVNPLGGDPTRHPEACGDHATKLLECLDLHGHTARSVRLKKVTVEIAMEDDCC